MQPLNTLSKNDLLYKYSNPHDVQQKAFQLYGKDAIIYKSTNKNKKYMIYDNVNKKFIHFGEIGYEDYTKHKNEQRLKNFRVRNKKWKTQPKYSPAYLSYYLLW